MPTISDFPVLKGYDNDWLFIYINIITHDTIAMLVSEITNIWGETCVQVVGWE